VTLHLSPLQCSGGSFGFGCVVQHNQFPTKMDLSLSYNDAVYLGYIVVSPSSYSTLLGTCVGSRLLKMTVGN
jgi:hypothetical protein